MSNKIWILGILFSSFLIALVTSGCFLQENTVAACENSFDEIERIDCYGQYYTKLAIENEDGSFCEKIHGSKEQVVRSEKQLCYHQFIREKPNNVNIQLCKRVGSIIEEWVKGLEHFGEGYTLPEYELDDVYAPLNECYIALATKEKDGRYCENVRSFSHKYRKWDCYMGLAFATKQATYCETILAEQITSCGGNEIEIIECQEDYKMREYADCLELAGGAPQERTQIKPRFSAHVVSSRDDCRDPRTGESVPCDPKIDIVAGIVEQGDDSIKATIELAENVPKIRNDVALRNLGSGRVESDVYSYKLEVRVDGNLYSILSGSISREQEPTGVCSFSFMNTDKLGTCQDNEVFFVIEDNKVILKGPLLPTIDEAILIAYHFTPISHIKEDVYDTMDRIVLDN